MRVKTVLITGASRGIGKEIALKFAKEGYQIVINCEKNKELLEEVERQIKKYHVGCYSFVGDIGNDKIAEQMFSEIQTRFNGIDILINNAGISYIGLLTDLSIEQWRKILDTNLNSVIYCSKLAIPHMLHKKEGKIITISSVWGKVGASCEVAYSTTKGAIHAFTKALAKELAPSNIQVNTIACGAIDTQMNEFLTEEEKAKLIEEIPAGRMGDATEVADFVHQISQSKEYLTGQVISFDGGWI